MFISSILHWVSYNKTKIAKMFLPNFTSSPVPLRIRISFAFRTHLTLSCWWEPPKSKSNIIFCMLCSIDCQVQWDGLNSVRDPRLHGTGDTGGCPCLQSPGGPLESRLCDIRDVLLKTSIFWRKKINHWKDLQSRVWACPRYCNSSSWSTSCNCRQTFNQTVGSENKCRHDTFQV